MLLQIPCLVSLSAETSGKKVLGLTGWQILVGVSFAL